MEKGRTVEEMSIDPAAQQMLKRAKALGIDTAFSRADMMAPCSIGGAGMCCKNCGMGPCRLTKDGTTGVCGATIDTIQARNMARAIAAGSASHSDHGRDLAFTLLAVAKGEAQGYEIRDTAKLLNVARYMSVPTAGRSVKEIALDVANAAVAQFGQQQGDLVYLKRAPEKRQKLWHDLGIAPRGIDREVVDILHRTHVGNDQNFEHIMMGAIRCALADGWGGSMLGTDISDILFGTPAPQVSQVNLGVLKHDEVNIVLHGHEPTLSEMIVAASLQPDIIAYARSKGAKGINLAGVCCTSNETLIRQGVPSAGNFLHQELALITGAVDAMVVDVQCIMQALPEVASHFHTRFITTSPKVQIKGGIHVSFDEHKALDQARDIVRMACDAYPERRDVVIPTTTEDLVPGFSHEYINYMLGGSYRASFRPLNDAIISGRIRGVVANVGCNNPRVTQDETHYRVVTEMLKNDVLVVETGCGALASAKTGYLVGEAAMKFAGPGLREVCEAIGIPPVLHMGSCVDNSRILTVLTQMAQEGGLGDDISDIPAVGIAPEWMSEKALAIGTYAAASGVYVIFGVNSPVGGMERVTDSTQVEHFMSEGYERLLGGKMEFVEDTDEMIRRTLEHIDRKRAALKLVEYDPTRFGKSGDRFMQDLLELPVAERAEALYGVPA
jgi:carbon-monoxide dehydrogenase catalytic subunit